MLQFEFSNFNLKNKTFYFVAAEEKTLKRIWDSLRLIRERMLGVWQSSKHGSAVSGVEQIIPEEMRVIG